MKRMITLLSAAVMLSAVSCSKVEQSTLSSETLPVKITVLGHVRSIATDSHGSQEEPMVVKSGTKVNVMYGLPDDEGNVEFALKTVETNTSGYFECEIGCPVGKSLSVKVNSSIKSYSYTRDKNGDYTESETYSYTRDKNGDYTESETLFFAELEKTVPCGKTVYFILDLTPSAYTSEDGLTQPAK